MNPPIHSLRNMRSCIGMAFYICIVSLFSGATSHRNSIDEINNEILTQFSKEMRPRGFYSVGRGCGEKDGKFNLLQIGFNVSKVLDIDTGRHLIVESANRLSEIINSNERYRDYFDPFPIDIKILRIDFFGEEPKTQNACKVWIVSLSRGTVDYEVRNDKPHSPLLMSIHEETFEEAREIVSRESTNS